MPTNAQQIVRLAAQRITLDAEWSEAQHKRDHGKFSSGGGGSSAARPSGAQSGGASRRLEEADLKGRGSSSPSPSKEDVRAMLNAQGAKNRSGRGAALAKTQGGDKTDSREEVAANRRALSEGQNRNVVRLVRRGRKGGG